MTLLSTYLEAWGRGDVDGVLATLADGCVVVDQDGALLRGREHVASVMWQWLDDGWVVHRLEVSDETSDQDVLTAQWTAEVTWHGVRATVEGRSVAHVRDGAISYLRGYTREPLGDWDGTWQP